MVLLEFENVYLLPPARRNLVLKLKFALIFVKINKVNN